MSTREQTIRAEAEYIAHLFPNGFAHFDRIWERLAATYDAGHPDTHKVVPKDAVVLDLSGSPVPRVQTPDQFRIWAGLVRKSWGGMAKWLDWFADQIEAQAKPPRIPEPGLWGVVEAGVQEHDQRLRWVNLGAGHWRPDDSGEYDRRWFQLLDPVLIREGV